MTTMTTMTALPLGAFDAVAQRPEMIVGIDMPFPRRVGLFMLTLTVAEFDSDDEAVDQMVADALDVVELDRLVMCSHD